MEIREHHRRAIQVLTDRYRDDPAFPALIIGGSIAKGKAKATSDLDVIFVASEEEYARRKAAGKLAFLLGDVCDYPGGYVDAKVFDVDFIREAAERGSEPARHAFIGAFPAYSRIAGLEELICKIPIYQEADQQEKINSFYSQLMLNRGYFWGEAEKRDDPYLKARTASELVLFGGRMILAHNRILFPCQKWLMEYVEQAPERPEAFALRAHRLLEQPSKEHVERFCECVETFRDWSISCDPLARYIEDSEWSWLTRTPNIAEW